MGKSAPNISVRQLSNDKQIKPIDFGNGGICGCISPTGSITVLNTFNAEHGFAGLNTARPFPFEKRYDQPSVREYRASLITLPGFGPRFSADISAHHCSLIADVIPKIELELADGSQASMTLIACEEGIVQRWDLPDTEVTWEGLLSLQRAAYTQLTEGGPLPDVPANMTLNCSEGMIRLSDDNLGCSLFIAGFADNLPEQVVTTAEPIEMNFAVQGNQSLYLLYTLAENDAVAAGKIDALGRYANEDAFDELLQKEAGKWEEYFSDVPDDIAVRRGLSYGRMVTIPTSSEAACIMTDHMLLPLSWNRDAYFVAIAFLQWGKPHWPLVRQHLIWMFEVADRGEDNEWGRCYLVGGQVKDRAYQLDQQLFPLLQLAEYVFCTGDTELFGRLRHHIQPLVDTILGLKHDSAMLFPTDETPGDDPLDYKFHFSSHILAWYTFEMLERLLPGSGYLDIAKQIHADTLKYFVANNGGKDLFSYATDLEGNHLFYHDANDVPLALAPDWGFVSADDPVWQATVEFAFTKENTNGYYDTDRLGSIHTPAPWPLGDVQKFQFARFMQKPLWEKEALADIQAAAQWDGALPEAYNSDDHSVRSRNWFAWPNAYYAMSQLPKLKF